MTSAIIINWNTREHLERCVRSFLAEGLPQRNIIVVDQASTDGSAAMIRKKFPKARLIQSDNLGYARAANLAMRKADGDIVVISNADVTMYKSCLIEIEKEFSKDERIGLIGSSVHDPSGKKVTRFSRTSVRRGIALELILKLLRGTWRAAEQRLYDRPAPFEVTYVEGAFMAVRRSLYNDLGGMDEGFSFFFEDADLPLRMIKAGFRVVHLPSAVVTHIGGASFSQIPSRHAADFYRNMVRLYRRHALRRALWLKRILSLVLRLKNLFLFPLAAFIPPLKSRYERNAIILDSLKNRPGSVATEDNPLVSVVIPTYHRPALVSRLISSLGKQSYPNFEVIVVDQSEKSSKLPKLRQPLRRIRLGMRNRSVAKNLGIRHAKGSIILFCDDDIVPERNFLQTHVLAHRDERIAGVSCRTTEDGLPDLKSRNICKVAWYGKVIDNFQSDVTCQIGTLVGGNMSVKRTAMMEAGYFDSIFRGTSILEEPDLSDRLRSLGYLLLFTNASTVRHEPQPDGNVGTRERNPVSYYHDFHHNEVVYFLKNRNHLLLPFVICFCFLRSVKQSIRYGLSFRQGLHMFMGVPAGFSSYYRSLK